MHFPRRQLSLFDAVCLIVGVIVGAGIYECAPTVARAAPHPAGVFGFWLLGGLLSFLGAMCYAELASAYPEAGGDYVYLTRAYGPVGGFLFGWFQLSIVRPGDIASLSLIFARHASALLGDFGWHLPFDRPVPLLAAAAIVLLTGINMRHVRLGSWTQNLLTMAKILGILLVVGVALSVSRPAEPEVTRGEPVSWQLALILVLFTFGGWNEMAYLAGEVRDPQRNILRGLVWGSAAVTAIYLTMNAAFMHALGHAGLAHSATVAQDAVGIRFPTLGKPLINGLICLSSLGAVSGLVFTGARISYAMGRDYRLFARIGQWHPRTGTPLFALLLQGVLAVGIVLILGEFVEAIIYTSAAVYCFYTFTCLSVFVLRRRAPHVPRPYRVIGFPYTVIVFAVTSAYLMYSALTYRPRHALAMVGFLCAGLVLYALHARWGDRPRWLEERQPESLPEDGS